MRLQKEVGNVLIIAGKNFSWKVSIIFQGISKVCDLGGILPTWVIKLASDLGGIRFQPHQPQITAAPPLKPFGMPIVFNVRIMMRWDFQKIDFYKIKYWKVKNKCFWFNVAQKIKIQYAMHTPRIWLFLMLEIINYLWIDGKFYCLELPRNGNCGNCDNWDGEKEDCQWLENFLQRRANTFCLYTHHKIYRAGCLEDYEYMKSTKNQYTIL